ncbi:CNNM domain-containing protein [Natrinema salsiterrestre]|uniref:Hemolysin family protein n=1 Tax=Natrinema salsiterrestre TaxID=2950540 RepID=A0A9Q4Q0W0_9EURY|nr:hemolysin family protein [Natrinema salsiterrestre]MDF9747090.1 hemolysin family protein [Natrinema salsiterrestre]
MDPLEIGLRLIAGIGLILANGFFVAIEFALTRVRQYPESAFDEPGLRRAWEMTDDLEIYLTSCQVGISATSIAVGIIAEPALATIIGPIFADTALASAGAGALLAFVIINLLHLTHGEQTPTYLGVERTKFVARYGATPLYWFAWLLSPVIWFGDAVAKWTLRQFGIEMTGAWLETETEIIETRADLRNRLTSVLEQGDLPTDRREEIINALTVGERPIEDAMTDIEDAVFLSTNASVDENLERIGSTPHTRFPLIEGTPAEFVGIVYVPTVVDRIDELRGGDVTFEDLATPPNTLPADTLISDAIDELQAAHQELALVADDGEIVGLLTATDALEELVGAFEDPLDTVDFVPDRS